MKNTKKFASLALMLALITQTIPAFTPHARAEEPITMLSVPAPDFEYGLGYLLRGFNALAEKPVPYDASKDKREMIGINFNKGIFNDNSFESLRSYTDYERMSPFTSSILVNTATVEGYAEQYGTSVGIGGGLDLGKKDAFKLTLGQKWNDSKLGSMAEVINTKFYQGMHWRREATYKIDFDSIPEYVIQEQLTQRFKDELLCVDPADVYKKYINGIDCTDPMQIFNKYGTHFLTNHALGGWIDAFVYSIDNAVSNSLKSDAGFSGVYENIQQTRRNYVEQNYDYVSGVNVYGGSGGVIHSTDTTPISTIISNWTQSFRSPFDYEIVTMGNNPIEFKGIWELLPEGYEDRYYELIGEYLSRKEGVDNDFFDNFVYKNRITSGVTPVNNVWQTAGNLSGVVGTSASQIPYHTRVVSVGTTCPNGETCIYSISTGSQLANIGGTTAAGRYFILINDINLTSSWTPINNFRGTLDGNGYKITNLHVNTSENQQYAGLFGLIYSRNVTIKNLGVEIGSNGVNAYRHSSTGGVGIVYAGGLIGALQDYSATIEQCYVTGSVVSAHNYLTGINLVRRVAIAGGLIGGMIGTAGATIKNSYVDNSDVVASAQADISRVAAGGLVGTRWDDNDKGGRISFENCYSSGKKTFSPSNNNASVGDLIAPVPTSPYSLYNTSVTSCYSSYDQSNSSNNVRFLTTYRTQNQMRSLQNNRSLFLGWDIDRTWENVNSTSYPSLRQFRTGPALILVYKNNLPSIYEGDVLTSSISNIFSVYYTPHLYSSYFDVTDSVKLRYNFTHASAASPIQIVYEVNGKTYVSDIAVTVLPNPTPMNLREIYVSSPPTKRVYNVGDTFNPAGMVVKAAYIDYSTAVISGYSITPNRPLTAADREITISYGGRSVSLPITVSIPVLDRIVINPPTKRDYFVGENLNTIGMVVTAQYSYGNSKIVTDYDYNPKELNSPGTQNITVSYTEGGITKTETFTVNVVAVVLNDIEVTKLPTKTSYAVGENLDPAGMEVTAYYNNNTNQLVTGYDYNPKLLNAAGTLPVTVSYTEGSITKTATFSVNVTDPNAPRITVSTVIGRAGKVVNVPITIFNNPGIAGIQLYISYDGDKIELEDYKPGVLSVPIPPLSIKANPILFVLEDAALIGAPEDGTLITLQFKVKDDIEFGLASILIDDAVAVNLNGQPVAVNLFDGGVNIRDFTYGDVNDDGNINVGDTILLRRYIALHDVADEINLAAADVNDDGNINVGDTILLRRYIALHPVTLGPQQGPQAVQAVFNSFNIGIGSTNADAVEVSVSNETAFPGETVNIVVSLDENPGLQGLDLTLIYDPTVLALVTETHPAFGTVASVIPGNIIPLPIPPGVTVADRIVLAFEATDFVIRYGTGVLATIPFRVLDNAVPGLTDITVKDPFAVDGNWGFPPVTANDGSVDVIPDDYLIGIAVTTLPCKVEYTEGDALDLSCMVVTAYYNSGNPKVVSGYTTSPSSGATLNTGDISVTVTYSEGGVAKNTSFPITVNPKGADYTALDNALAIAETKNAADYTEASWAALEAAVTAGKGVARNLTVDNQGIIDAAALAITKAIEGLELRPLPADYTALDNALAIAETKNSADYTEASWAALEAVVTAGKGVARNLTVDNQGIIDTAALAITKAIADLVVKPIELPDLHIAGYTLVGSTRFGLTAYDYELTANVVNLGGAAENVTAVLTGYQTDIVTVIKGVIELGDIPANGTSQGNFIIRIPINRNAAYDESQLEFTFSYAE